MKSSIILIFLSLLFTATVKAGVFTTLPFGETKWRGGSIETITWKDNGTAPNLSDLQTLKIDLYMGNDTSIQNFVANIKDNVKGTDGQTTYKVPKDIGPPGQYFIRYTQGAYGESSGVFNIIDVNGKAPTSSALVSVPNSVSVTGYNPYITSTNTATGSVSSNPTSVAQAKDTTSPTSTITTPASISSSNIIHSNYLTLGSLMILGRILLKYL